MDRKQIKLVLSLPQFKAFRGFLGSRTVRKSTDGTWQNPRCERQSWDSGENKSEFSENGTKDGRDVHREISDL